MPLSIPNPPRRIVAKPGGSGGKESQDESRNLAKVVPDHLRRHLPARSGVSSAAAGVSLAHHRWDVDNPALAFLYRFPRVIRVLRMGRLASAEMRCLR